MEYFPKLTENILECIIKSKNGEIIDKLLNPTLMCNLAFIFSSQSKQEKLIQIKKTETNSTKEKDDTEENQQKDNQYYIPLSRLALTFDEFHISNKKFKRNWSVGITFSNSLLEERDFMDKLGLFKGDDIQKIKGYIKENEVDFFQVPIQNINYFSEKEKEDDLLMLINSMDSVDFQKKNDDNNTSMYNSMIGKVNQKYSDIRKSKIFNDSTFATEDSSSFIRSTNWGKKSNITTQIPIDTFGLKEKVFNQYKTKMNEKYISIIKLHFDNLNNKSINPFFDENEIDSTMFIKLFKQLILKFGISSIKLFNEVLRRLVYSKRSLTFEDFIMSFNPILKLKVNEGIIKFKFLLNILVKDISQSYLSLTDLQTFFEFIICNDIYESDICEDLTLNLVGRYKDFNINTERENIAQGQFDISKLLITIDTFYLY